MLQVGEKFFHFLLIFKISPTRIVPFFPKKARQQSLAQPKVTKKVKRESV
jgi:hypothetical protein